ncbi:MAG: hypothetical protein Q7V58_04285 [Actinomycetota bacterium]|nr:hypothetical protein [Actinomycetota bacterium]
MSTDTATRRWGVRSIASLLIFLLAAVLTPIALVGHWGHRTVIDSERYLETVGPLIEQPDVQQALAASITDAVVERIDTETQVEGLLSSLFPNSSFTGPLASPIAAGINGLIGELVVRFVASDQFQQAWIALNRAAQRGLIALLEGGQEGPIQVKGDEIVLDISSALAAIQTHLVENGISAAAGLTLPEGDRQIVLGTVQGLGQIRFIYSLTSPILQWFPLLVAAMFALSIALARRRARTVVAAGIVLVGAAGLIGLGLSAGEAGFVDELAGTPFGPAANEFWTTLLTYLVLGNQALLTLGIITILAGWLGGRTSLARYVRGHLVRGLDQLGDRLPEGLQGFRQTVTGVAPYIRWVIYLLGGLLVVLNDIASPATVLWCAALTAGLITGLQVLVNQEPPANLTEVAQPTRTEAPQPLGQGPAGPGPA